MKKLITLILLCIAANCFSQQLVSHSHHLAVNYLQVKEELNYGLVFTGPGLNYNYAFCKKSEDHDFNYEAHFGFTYFETREIGGGNIHFIPLKANYLFHLKNEKLKVGPSLIAEYNYELYPDLQSGFSFWFTHFSLGASAIYLFDIGKNSFETKLNTTVFGITSRPPVARQPYFFDLSIGYAFKFVHDDLQSGSWNKYNVTDFEIQWKSNEKSRIAFAYCFQYSGYFDEPEISMLNQALKIIFLPKSE